MLRKPDIEVGCVEFVRDAYYKEKSMDHFQDVNWDKDKFVSYDGVDFVIRDSDDLTAVFMMNGEDPSGYVALDRFMDGVQIGTISVIGEYRGGAMKKLYNCIVREFGLLYSGDNQTARARGGWNSLFKSGEFDVYAVDSVGMKRYEVKSVERELDLVDVGLSLYGEKRFLLCIEKVSRAQSHSV